MQEYIQNILDFWFGKPSDTDYGKPQSFWFESTPAIDQQIKLKYEAFYEKAKAGIFDEMRVSAEGVLALILMLDQLPRHIFRNSKEAFATDNMALFLAKTAINQKFDQQLPVFMRLFVYLPFEHSENLTDQKMSVQLFEELGEPRYLDYALRHYNIIERFGRFPHRNKLLNRQNTGEEDHFLAHEFSGF